MKHTHEAEEALQNAMAAIDAVYHLFMHERNLDNLFNAICDLKTCIQQLERIGGGTVSCQS